ncbi:MAG: ATP phosphoribosyltransferase [Hyphomonadaceae bacterium]|jgi:ATP phosphoribosyltransferase|uniref:ATP phosphoribosyltransferase n=1 Tax=Aquidulcibacter sp. TaxID=2052990 RepID=UPI0022BB9481|nr:ATP phosphoribosyltransferase [Aquidulcibacter sp.]MCE2889996.1 ATP phosphoribosyltransferase [Hyphomonadaceae bacterium]MCZ8207758.1 ATP phosphoribosyltransferase [Aquidulcibacter sp.]
MASLILALPSKGRLKEQCEAWLAKKGLVVRQTGGERGYSATLDGFDDVQIRLASASEIGKALLAGDIHLGITGEDIVREAAGDVDARLTIEARLGFGRADVVVAVPNGWIDVETMADLAEVATDMRRQTGRRFRIATKFTRLTAQFMRDHHVADHRIVDSAGATEGAPAAGIAEAIVDITTSGATLTANALKILDDGVILKSESCLMKSKLADWNEATRASAAHLFKRLELA